MDTGKRQHLQDIYSTDRSARDDYTPQVSAEIIEERKRDLRRHQFFTFFLGATVLILLIALVFIVAREYMQMVKDSAPVTPITREYIPRYSLPKESQWVLDLGRSFGDPKWDGEGDRPFNTLWVKKAAFNVVLAEQSLQVGEFQEAAEYYENALEILPDLDGVRVPLGMIYFKLKRFDEALALLEKASDADLTYDILNNLGAACIEAKAYDRAENYIKRSLELKPSYPMALKNLAVLKKTQDQSEEAIAAYEQYLDQMPTDEDTRHDFALYLTKIGNWKLAGEQLRILAEEWTDVASLYFVLAQVETKLGNSDAAIDALRRGFQLTDPSVAIASMNEEEFDQLRNNEDFQALIKYAEEKR